MARIIITGCNGQLGRALSDQAHLHPHHSFTGVDIDRLDICDKPALEIFLRNNPADVLINCAAYTAVDHAEDEPEKAFRVNGEGVKNLAALCSQLNIRLIHISTDYVFDGRTPLPCHEEQLTNPLSVYGQSKLEGEIGILYHCNNAVIIRTSWLYYPGSKNFVSTILQLATQRKQLKVVYDQVGSPTYAGDLAEAIMKVIDTIKEQGVSVYHYSNSGVTSWYDFAMAIIEMTGLSAGVEPVLTGTLGQKAARPAYSVMNCDKIRKDFSLNIPHWREGLKKYLRFNENQHLTDTNHAGIS